MNERMFLDLPRLLLAGVLLTAVAVAEAEVPWQLVAPPDQRVPFHGEVSFDGAGVQQNAMMYPAFGVAGLFAAVATHAAITEGVKEAQKAHIERRADKVLAPYAAVLDEYKLRELLERALHKVQGDGAQLLDPVNVADDWRIEAAPTAALTQDERGLVLDTAIAIYGPGDGQTPRYRNLVRVVSAPMEEDSPREAWIAAEGVRLKEEAAGLLAETLRLAWSAAFRPPAEDLPQKTIRFRQGHKERIERAQVLSEACDRRVLVNLRGWLMSVPRTDANCAPAQKNTSTVTTPSDAATPPAAHPAMPVAAG